ncbi:hypothetical protein MARU1_000709 [Malassezia arunalokei]|uniref:CRAL-TRIO domain-containing protein n=1 Tax=Malassezia arunalokei TaxID=1514897 RepID=A0AAJ5Z0I4_9BASI|nr:hypothetical protein MARU1_000709 [Malassezia arunalokei]
MVRENSKNNLTETGNLNADQKSKLSFMWDLVFTVLNHPDKAVKGEFSEEDELGHHDAHLSKQDQQKQAKSLKEEQEALQELFATHGVEEFHDQLWFLFGPDIPDMIMLKFLRARKWNVHRAFAMLCKCIKWRIESDVMGIVAKGDLGLSREDPTYAIQGPAEKVYSLGYSDKNVMPVIMIHVKNHVAAAQPAETMTKFVISAAETFRTLVVYPNDKVIVVFDMSGFGMRNMDWHSLMTVLKILEGYYPETLAKLYIYRAPWIFQGIWKAINPLLDPEIRNKINFCNKSNELDVVPQYICEDTIGGDQVDVVKWVEPLPGEKEGLDRNDPKRQEMWKSYRDISRDYEEVTKKWIISDGQDDTLNAERDLQSKRLRLKFIELEPFIRARSMYQRAGIINEDLLLQFNYKQKDGRVLRQVIGADYARPALAKAVDAYTKRSEKSRWSTVSENGIASKEKSGMKAGMAGATSTESFAAGPRQSKNVAANQDVRTSNDMTDQRQHWSAENSFDRAQKGRTGLLVETRENRLPESSMVGSAATTSACANASENVTKHSMGQSQVPEMFNASRQYRPRGGSNAPSIVSSMSDDVFVDADDFEEHDSSVTNGLREMDTGESGGMHTVGDSWHSEIKRSSGLPDRSKRIPTHSSGRRAQHMEAEDDQLAGFPNLAHSEKLEEIADNNEKMREPFDPTAGPFSLV